MRIRKVLVVGECQRLQSMLPLGSEYALFYIWLSHGFDVL